MNSDFQATLRRLKPEKRQAQLKPRAESALDFIETTSNKSRKLLYDTTVYIDILQGRFPERGELMLQATEAWHSPVTEVELAARASVYLILLTPTHARSSNKLWPSSNGDRATEPLCRIPRYGAKHRHRNRFAKVAHPLN